MVYIFIPSAIWVIYKNFKNFKITKKDIAVLIFELLLTVLLIGRIFYNCRDAISAIMNTIYPGNRFLDSGGALQKVLFSNTGILLPFLEGLQNKCELSAFIDFLPITIILLIYNFAEFKRKDFLTIAMCIVSVILLVYTAIPLPHILLKILFLNYTTSKRVSAVVGLLNLFMLARILSLQEENLFNKRKSAIIAVGISFVIAICSGTIFGEKFNLISRFVMFIIFAFLYYMILNFRNKNVQNIFLIAIIILSITIGTTVNPLRRGIDNAIYDNELSREIQKINKENSGTWVAEFGLGNFLMAQGCKTVNSINRYPNLGIWHKVDKDLKYEEIYNRYAHIGISLSNEVDLKMRLIYEDSYLVQINLDNLKLLGVDYVFTINNYDDGEMDTEKYKLNNVCSVENYNIYKLVEK